MGEHHATPAMTDRKEREASFLRDLTELTRKHGLVLESTDAALVEKVDYRFPFGRDRVDLVSGGYVFSKTRAAIQWSNEPLRDG